MDISLVVNITSRAWCLPILGALHDGVPARQAPLMKASGAGRTAFAQSLHHLLEIGVLERNPGHGHPLRPEYRLTQTGRRAAPMARRILDAGDPVAPALVRKNWSVPILTCLSQPAQFSSVRRALPGITDRALSQSLKRLEAVDWVARTVDVQARPPKPIYCAINQGSVIGDAAQRLVSV
jgi:DNA-binding HxlR family transcriptional regulator